MRIAIISDIHSNYQALKKVIEDIRRKNIDKVICAGDIIGKGINSRKCIDLVRENCDIVLRGNTDDRFSQNAESFRTDEVEYNRIKWNQSLLTEVELAYLQSLPMTTEFYLSGNLVRVFHATPESVYSTINNYNMDFSKKRSLFLPSNNTESHEVADIVIFGHVHYQFMEKIYNRTLVNCGSVGCPGCLIYDEEHNSTPTEIRQAHYLIVEGDENSLQVGDISITFQSVEYDIQKEFNDNKLNPEKESYYDELFNAKYRGIKTAMKRLEEEGFKF